LDPSGSIEIVSGHSTPGSQPQPQSFPNMVVKSGQLKSITVHCAGVPRGWDQAWRPARHLLDPVERFELSEHKLDLPAQRVDRRHLFE